MSAQDPGARNTESLPRAAVFKKCLVEPDPASASRIRARRRRSIAASAFVELSILGALLIWPLFAAGTRLVARHFTPIPPYGGFHSQEPTRPRRTLPPGVPTIYDPVPHSPRPPVHIPIRIGGASSPGQDIPKLDGLDLHSSNATSLIPLPGNETGPQPPTPAQPERLASSAPIRRSEGVQSALLLHRVEPRYPALAQQIHREGTVQLHAVISRDGTIEALEVLSGDPLFIRSAVDAVREWRYRPTVLNGEPVEVETYITVYFRLSDA